MAQAHAMMNAKQVILDVGRRFGEMTGRSYGFFEAYRLEDAEVAILLIGSSAGTARACVDELREQGKKVGMLKLRVFRPFPAEEIAEALKNVKAVAVLDKTESFSANGGPLGAEVRGALYDLPTPPRVVNYVYDLGGRDFRVTDCAQIFAEMEEVAAGNVGATYRHIGQREE